MSLFSNFIQIQPKEIQSSENFLRSKKSSSFFKKDRKRSISKEIQEEFLLALKAMIAKQKQLIDSQQSLSSGLLSHCPQSIQDGAEANYRIEALASSEAIHYLHEKLLEKLLFTHKNGLSETTFFLDSQLFGSSIFYGSQITISEYSTAPKIFNIHFTAHSEALSLFEAHSSDLMAAFQKGNFGFAIHRIDTSLLSEKKHLLIPKVERDLEKEEKQ